MSIICVMSHVYNFQTTQVEINQIIKSFTEKSDLLAMMGLIRGSYTVIMIPVLIISYVSERFIFNCCPWYSSLMCHQWVMNMMHVLLLLAINLNPR